MSYTERPAAYLLDAFGLHDQWVRWRLKRGFIDDDGRLTSEPVDTDIGDEAGMRLARKMGIHVEPDNPSRPRRMAVRHGRTRG